MTVWGRGHFDGERVGTPCPLLERLRTPTSAQEFCRILHICRPNLKIFSGIILPDSRKRSRCLDPDSNFRLARQHSRRSCFTKQPLVWYYASLGVHRAGSRNFPKGQSHYSGLQRQLTLIWLEFLRQLGNIKISE